MAAPEDGEEERDQDDGDSGEEGGLGGRGVEQAGGLEFIAEPHEGADLEAGAEGSEGERAQMAEEDGAEDDGGKDHAHGVEDERGGVGERRLDDDEGGAPDKGRGQQQEMSLERTRHHQAPSDGLAESDSRGSGDDASPEGGAVARGGSGRCVLGREAGEEEEEKGEALECLLASGGIEPLVQGVGSATGASGAEGNRVEAEGRSR